MNTNSRLQDTKDNYKNVQSDFYVDGGTLDVNSPSYVQRPEDEKLFELVQAGRFCYILTARQLGKSSLMVQTANKLEAKGIKTVIIDLSQIGADVTVNAWYLGLLSRFNEQLDLKIDVDYWWKTFNLSPADRFRKFLDEIVLQNTKQKIVVFVDEIDSTLSLSFSDDFFASVRALYNARPVDKRFNRLTFVLLGVATPAELMKDHRRTPFNVGQQIELRDFDRNDAEKLELGLEKIFPNKGKKIVDQIFYWTNGHPYLTQKLCKTTYELDIESSEFYDIDGLVDEQFLSIKSKSEDNLKFVNEGISKHPQSRQLLKLYQKVHKGQEVADDGVQKQVVRQILRKKIFQLFLRV